MNCDECKTNPATVHVMTIMNGKKKQVHLCEECASKKEDMNSFISFSINDLLASFLDMSQETPQQLPLESSNVPKCSRCGLTYNDFKKIGRLGCSHCYKDFREELLSVLRRVHGSTQHVGKVPKKAGAELIVRKEIETIKNDLNLAIQQEAFEKAVELRDKIRELEKKQIT